ncbi:glycoside hydrolase family 15 protein [Methylorubrum extorquens]|uniref:Glucoamylase, (Glucan 1,4-alpha-glucosidase) n=1 Tax=Methylorubrum extorquens (strain ATCC 14718 / DSM 1338 / JCM 2805 / NCIMB 9133 / AM1) TaxID=272630 RepID=C5B1R4_METEA|nr:glycoside hydrolase family 15 protein [Methylorubrum extorquens]ACS39698.1 Putative glucoamylase, (glucan 1,4-alpha-glucosidase) [Methylorubrum extorquens AM1]MCP1542184.1 glucoamylase [Methylorubrum extorquens]MCP1590471.1 glucoamylase [Methylorubrum extorquens]
MDVRNSGQVTLPPADAVTAVQAMRARPRLADHLEPDATFDAPGAPGIPPTWTSSAKDVVGCSLGAARLWFTLGYGIVNEVYWPRVDLPQIRDLGFIVADGKGFWAEVKRGGDYSLRSVASGVPAYEIVHAHARYTLRLRISPDPRRDVLAVECSLESGEPDLRLYVLLAPHLGATGYGNRATVAQHRGRRVLWAERSPFALALAAVDELQQDAIGRASAGYVGASDGWQDFARNGAMTWDHPAAGPGNVALMAELPNRCVLALGFGSSREAATTLAVSSLMQPFDNILQAQATDWEAWHRRCGECCASPVDVPGGLREQFVTSTTVLRTHLDKTYPGAMVASLSVPWGDSGNERGGYHLVWPRDLVECAGALLAFGGEAEARDTLRYLIATQSTEGHWHQNQWLGGEPFWRGLQLDETAFPVLLAAALADRDALGGIEPADMVRRALGCIARRGPSTDQDRWEENAGLNTFTLATCIAAFVTGSAFLDGAAGRWGLALADFWNANIEDWTVAEGTDLAREAAVSGYYVRTAPPTVLQNGRGALDELIPIRNRADGATLKASEQVSTDFLQLVRFGLRSPNDPLIRDSLKVVDRLLKVDTPSGPVWRRYNGDGYGEHEDGRPYDGTGVGRPWPLLAGERGHYDLLAGQDVLPILNTMAATASPGGMIPEQVWDAGPISQRRLHLGRPTGSAMPLVWAHAEFIKLLVSRNLGHPFDRPRAVWERYKGRPRKAECAFWWPHAQIRSAPAGSRLVIALPRPGVVRWGRDGWQAVTETAADETGLGFHAAILDTAELSQGGQAEFTIRWDDGDWIGADYRIEMTATKETRGRGDGGGTA